MQWKPAYRARVVSKSPLLPMKLASTHSSKHPRELCFSAGEGELTSMPTAVSVTVTASALGKKVLSQRNGDSPGHQHKSLAEEGAPESLCPTPQQEDFSSIAE